MGCKHRGVHIAAGVSQYWTCAAPHAPLAWLTTRLQHVHPFAGALRYSHTQFRPERGLHPAGAQLSGPAPLQSLGTHSGSLKSYGPPMTGQGSAKQLVSGSLGSRHSAFSVMLLAISLNSEAHM